MTRETKFFISPPFGNYLDLEQTISIKGSFTLYPREGIITQALKTIRYSFANGGWVNKMGLRNKGIDYAIQKYKDKDCIVSVAILKAEDIPILNRKIPSNMSLELNVSCPNVIIGDVNKSGAVDKNSVENILINQRLHYFLNNDREWCIIKLPPNVEVKLVDFYYKEGFRQFHCSNTIPVPEGGLSGKKVKEMNKYLIPALREKYGNEITIISGGGIDSIKDITDYKEFGADHMAFSTVFFCPIKAYKLYDQLDAMRKIVDDTY